MGLDQIITVNISATSPGVTRQGFGVPLILGTPSWATDRVRYYADISDVALDFASTRVEYLEALVLFSQTPRPERVGIGRLASKPTQIWDITPAVANLTDYKVRVGASTVTYTSDGTATLAEIVVGLKAAIDALALPLTVTTPGSATVHVVANNAGDWFDIEMLDIALLSVAQTGTDPGVSADLDAILLADATWYAIVNPWASAAVITSIATWAEANLRLFLADTQDSQCALHVLAAATDIMATINTSARKYTSVWYHPAPGSFLAAAEEGRCLPLTPGSETWALKNLSGPVPTPKLTTTQRANILAKQGNVYELVAGLGCTNNGTVSTGEYIDVIRLSDWTRANMKEDIFTDVLENDKIPYDNAGIAKIAGDVTAVLAQGVENGGFTDFTVTVPKASAATTADRQARKLRNLKFKATLAGAIHTVFIDGSVSV